MKMKKPDLDRAIDWITEHWSGDEKRCPICQHTNWVLNPIIAELRSFQKGQLIFGGPVFPVITINCVNCGLVLQFSAKHLGIVKSPPLASPSVSPSAPKSATSPPNGKEASDE